MRRAGARAITVVGATQESARVRIVLTLAYAVGAAMPMLLVAFVGRAADECAQAARADSIRRALGVVVALTALAIAFNVDRQFQTAVPGYTEALQKRVEAERRAETRARAS